MRVLVVGGGGREHALCWKLSQSPRLTKLWCAPGNAGIAEVAECVPLAAEDVPALVAFAREHAADLVVAGPEAPLTLGLADACAAAGLRCFGPSAAAARLEGSKAFMKEVADAAGVPTARWARFTDPAAARAYVQAQGAPIVVKADGLAAGKGVVVAATVAEAEAAIADIMESRAHGAAGDAVVIEECLAGEEVSFFALCDGTHALPCGAAQDHKRVGEGDTGPNTGGMGAYSPPPMFTPALEAEVMARMIRPTLKEMARRGTPFRGVLFAGLMLTQGGPKLLEYNVRFGDPECQALMVRLKSDLLPVLLAASEGSLEGVTLEWDAGASLVVVMAARGYPGVYDKGSIITELKRAAEVPNVTIFHAGTCEDANGNTLANGGRVLCFTGSGRALRSAREAAYDATRLVRWRDGFFRNDVGLRALLVREFGATEKSIALGAVSMHENSGDLTRIKDRIKVLVEQKFSSGEGRYYLSQLGNDLGNDRILIESLTGRKLASFIQEEFDFSFGRAGQSGNVLYLSAPERAEAKEEFLKKPRFNGRLWAAFAKSLEPGQRRFIDLDSCLFGSSKEALHSTGPNVLEIPAEYLTSPSSDTPEDKALIVGRINCWLKDNNLDQTRFLAKQKADTQERYNLLDQVIAALDEDQLKRVSLPLDAVRALKGLDRAR